MRRTLQLSILGALVGTLCACGDPPPEPIPPLISDPAITCGASSDPLVDFEVVTQVDVKVTDGDQDLVAVEGQLNNLEMTLEDPDVDDVYSWSPGEELDPVACNNELFLRVTARDLEENVDRLEQALEP